MDKRTVSFLRALPFAVGPPVFAVPAIRFFAVTEPDYARVINTGICVLVVAAAAWSLWNLRRTFVGKFDVIAVLSVLTSAFAGLIIYLATYLVIFGNLFRMAR